MMKVVLDPEKVTAHYAEGRLVIHATGHEDGVQDITIERKDLVEPIEPPEFSVVGEQSPAIGMFPYAVTKAFELAANPREIVIVLTQGSERIPVT